MARVAVTTRLELREFSVAEAEDFYQLNADTEVVRYTGDGPFASLAEARAFLERYDNYRRDGFGRWSCNLRQTGAYIGWCGLNRKPGHDEVDIGFRFHRRYWGHGYATEAARAALALGFGRFGLREIVGRARSDNTASHAVLRKLGMQPAFAYVEDGHTWMQYRLRTEDFAPPQ
jgi:RimJ/RimL family protein N-acetyltransferase